MHAAAQESTARAMSDARLSATLPAGPDHPLPTHDPALVEALAQLDPAYRMPILLHYYADLSLEQVGQSLNLSIPAIKSRLHRARAQLRNSLAEAEETEETR